MTDRHSLILIAIGPDKVGLVEEISDYIKQYGCNIEDSKMAVMAGEFAYIVLISGSELNITAVADNRNTLSSQTGLEVFARKPLARKSAPPSLPYEFRASCMDHPGVVHRLSTTLSDLGINIESMETKTYAAPDSGTAIFRMEAMLSIPASVSINQLRAQLAEIEKQENIDIDLIPAH